MTLLLGDCLDVMATLPAESVDAVVTDPPYDLTDSSSFRLGSASGRSASRNQTRGFMGKTWDGTGIAFRPETWAAALRVAKPSAYLLAFGGTRTVHRIATAIEDAGWIIRDMLVWAYASGFPKSKASLKPAWEPIVMARKPGPLRMLAIDECRIPAAADDRAGWHAGYEGPKFVGNVYGASDTTGTGEKDPLGRWPANLVLTDPIFDGGWEGVVGGGEAGGSKPFDWTAAAGRASFPVGREASVFYDDSGTYSRFFSLPEGTMGTCYYCGIAGPVDASFAPSRQRDGSVHMPAPIGRDGMQAPTGHGQPSLGLNEIELGTSETSQRSSPESGRTTTLPSGPPANRAERPPTSTGTTTTTQSRWTCELCAALVTPDSTHPLLRPTRPALPPDGADYSRFLVIPKADRGDREPVLGGLPKSQPGHLTLHSQPTGAPPPPPRSNVHPTVKPVDLMRHLVRLVTPQGGIVLDPFLGSGTTAIAAEMEGFDWIGIEREAEYVAIAEARLNGVQRGLGLPA